MPRITPFSSFTALTEPEAKTLRYILDSAIIGGALPDRSDGNARRILSRLNDGNEPNIARMLDVSTAHLSQAERTDLEYDRLPGQVASTSFGGVVAASFFDPAVSDDVPDGASQTLLAIIRYALARKCAYVLFDADAPSLPGFPTLEADE